MSIDSWAGAAGLLAVAVLAAPGPPRRRLVTVVRQARSGRVSGLVSGTAAVAIGVGVAILVSPGAVATVVTASGLAAARRRRQRRARRQRAEGAALAAALETLVGELRIGAHPVRAFDVAAEEAGGAVGRSLWAVAGRARLGADVTGGLRAVADRSAVPIYWERIAVCWQLASEQGLAMATLMRAAQRDIVDRQRFADSVQAGTAGARATAAILASLPVLGVLLGQVVGAHPLRFLLGSGGWFLVSGVALIGLGVAWSDRIVDRVAR